MLRLFIKIFFRIIFILLIIGAVGAWIFDTIYRSDGYHGPLSDHFDGKRFYNIGTPKDRNLSFHEKLSEFFDWLTASRPYWEPHPIDLVTPVEYYTGAGIKVTSVGHATFLIQLNGINILTDPIWTSTPSPFRTLSHGRYTNPGVEFSNLPPIDAVLISHNHYDHMDLETLIELMKRDDPTMYSGLGNTSYLRRNNIPNSVDMDWFNTVTLSGGINITFVPALHYSARAFSDRRTTLWGGFVIEGGGKSLYFAGDTALGNFADAIKTKYPNGFDIGLLPIGAYRPTYIMKDKHTNPREALTLQKELNIRTAIGMHYGTFSLGGDAQDEPASDFEIAKKDFPTQLFELGRVGKEWVFE